MEHEHPAYHEGYKDGYGHGHKDGKKGKESKKLKTGGAVDGDKIIEGEPRPYNAIGSHEEREAEQKKHGGRLARRHGGAAKVEHMAEGHEAKPRHDRLPRKSGGAVNMGKSPFSEAARVTSAQGRKGVDGDISEGD